MNEVILRRAIFMTLMFYSVVGVAWLYEQFEIVLLFIWLSLGPTITTLIAMIQEYSVIDAATEK